MLKCGVAFAVVKAIHDHTEISYTSYSVFAGSALSPYSFNVFCLAVDSSSSFSQIGYSMQKVGKR